MSERSDSSVEPERTCAGCRQRDAAERLVRFVVRDGRLYVDASRRFGGRGAWAHARRGCIERGVKRGGFAHALQAPVRDEPRRVLDEALAVCRNEALQRLGLLRRSGALRFGREQACLALRERSVAALWLAQDAAARTARAVREAAGEVGVPVHTVAAVADLAHALGAATVAVVALPDTEAGRKLSSAVSVWAQLADEAAVYIPSGAS